MITFLQEPDSKELVQYMTQTIIIKISKIMIDDLIFKFDLVKFAIVLYSTLTSSVKNLVFNVLISLFSIF